MVASNVQGDLLTLACRREVLLDQLASGPCRRGELHATSDAARSTLDRGLEELEGASVIEPCPEGYRLTLYGRVVYELLSELRRSLTTIGENADGLGELPADAPFDPALLHRARILEGRDARDELGPLLGGTRRVRLVLTGLPPDLPNYTRHLGQPDRLEVVLPKSTARRLATGDDEIWSTMPDDVGTVELRETADTLPYTLLVVEGDHADTAAICAHVAGAISLLLVWNDETAITWALERFEGCWDEGTPLPSP